MGIPCMSFFAFPLLLFLIFSLSLIFISLINMCLGMFHLGFILYGTLCASWTWVSISFPILGKFSIVIFSNIFSDNFSFSSSSGTPIIPMLVLLMLSQKSLRLSSFLPFFFLYSAPQQLFPTFYLPAHLSILLPQLFCY